MFMILNIDVWPVRHRLKLLINNTEEMHAFICLSVHEDNRANFHENISNISCLLHIRKRLFCTLVVSPYLKILNIYK